MNLNNQSSTLDAFKRCLNWDESEHNGFTNGNKFNKISKRLPIKPFLESTPSKITIEDFVYLIEMKIKIMKDSFNKIAMQFENLEFAEQIQQLNNHLDALVARKATKLEYAEAIDNTQMVLDRYKDKATEEVNYKKRLIQSRKPIDLKQIALNDLDQKIKITTCNRNYFIEHLLQERNKLTNIKVSLEITQKINDLKYTYDRFINNLKKNFKDLKLKTRHEEILTGDLNKLDKSLNEIEKQYKNASAKLFERRLKAHLPKDTNKLRPQKAEAMTQVGDGEHVTQNAKVRRITDEIQKIDLNIQTVNKITMEAIEKLENQKLDIKQKSGPSAVVKTAQLDKGIVEIIEQHDAIVQKLTGKQAQIKLRQRSIDVLGIKVSELDREIARIQAQGDNAIGQLARKKKLLLSRLGSVEKLDQLINVLTYRIYTVQQDFRVEIDEINKQKEEILNSADLDENQKAVALANLDRKLADNKNMHEAAMISLYGQKDELERESAQQTSDLEDKMSLLRKENAAELAEQEALLVNATPSETEEIKQKIDEINAKFEQELAELVEKQASLKQALLQKEPSTEQIDPQQRLADLRDT